MYFSIPVSYNEIIVDTPVDMKSIRSFFFVDRNSGCLNVSNGLPTITISVDGKDICRDLFILPFMTQATLSERMFQANFDSRNVAITCLKNIDMSEIKISACGNLDFEVVFEMEDIEVETEKVEFFEGFTIAHPFTNEMQIFTEQESEKIFVFSGQNNGGKIINNCVPGYDNMLFYAHSSAYEADTSFTISTTEEVMPQNMPISMLSPCMGLSWKEAQYQFDNKLSKQPRFRFTDVNGMLPADESRFWCVIMLSYDKLF